MQHKMPQLFEEIRNIVTDVPPKLKKALEEYPLTEHTENDWEKFLEENKGKSIKSMSAMDHN